MLLRLQQSTDTYFKFLVFKINQPGSDLILIHNVSVCLFSRLLITAYVCVTIILLDVLMRVDDSVAN